MQLIDRWRWDRRLLQVYDHGSGGRFLWFKRVGRLSDILLHLALLVNDILCDGAERILTKRGLLLLLEEGLVVANFSKFVHHPVIITPLLFLDPVPYFCAKLVQPP